MASAMLDSNYGIRSLSSSFGCDSSGDLLGPSSSPSLSIGSTSSAETALPAPAEHSTPPQQASMLILNRVRGERSHPGSPAFSDTFEHLSDASRCGGMLSTGDSDNEEHANTSARVSDHDEHRNQLVLPTLVLRAADPPELDSITTSASQTRFGVIGRAGDLLTDMFGGAHIDAQVAEIPAHTDPSLAVARLESAFTRAQRILRDDIPRELHDTLIRILASLPDLAALDALLLPVEIPPPANLIELAAALHSFVNLVPVVRTGDEEAIAALESQLVMQGIQWVSPRDFDVAPDMPFFLLSALDEGSPFGASAPAAYKPFDLDILRQRSLHLYLRWRAVDLAARGDADVPVAHGAAFAEQVARRRARLADEEEQHSSADSGVAADDEGAGQAGTILRTRHVRNKRKHCGPYDDPLSFDIALLGRVGINAAGKALRLGANLILVSTAIVAIFGAGLGIGWAGSTGLAALYESSVRMWRSMSRF